jgi:hypothetical protein
MPKVFFCKTLLKEKIMQKLKLVAALAVGLFVTGSAMGRPSASPIVPGFDSNTFDPNPDDPNPDDPLDPNSRWEDGSIYVTDIGFTVNFFGNTYTGLGINENGNVTFGLMAGSAMMFNMADSTYPIIAPFFTDVSNGSITYGTGTYDGQAAFGVNWINVTPYNVETEKNTFQLLLVDRANGDFDIIFNYGAMSWNNENQYRARVGYASGTYPNIFHELDYSSIAALADTPHVFEIRAVPEPETYAMLLAGLGIVTVVARRRRND